MRTIELDALEIFKAVVDCGGVGKLWDVLEVWRQHARAPVQGRALNSGHYLAEEQPEEVLQELLRFFAN